MSLLDQYAERVAGDAVRGYFQSSEFKGLVDRHVRWAMQGYELGYGPAQRRAFTETVAARLHEKGREPVYLFGWCIWRKRLPLRWCADEAERIVTEFLRSDRIKFGDRDYHWQDGVDLADADMDYWERCP